MFTEQYCFLFAIFICKTKSDEKQLFFMIGIPYGIRTRVTALRRQRPRPLDERDIGYVS